MSTKLEPIDVGLLGERRRVRLLVEGWVPNLTYYGLVIQHNQDLDAVHRELVPLMIKEFDATIKEPKRQSRPKGDRIVLQLPDDTKVRVATTGRPPRAVEEWKKLGYVIDWETETMVKKPKPTKEG
jgi:hypothetical protein